jgi:predicted DCC family thiol-disulfide oxidoreductase YuxK
MQLTNEKSGCPANWVLYDGGCGFCARWVQFWKPTLAKRGIGIAALQDSWVIERLNLPPEDLLRDIRLLTADDKLHSGADVYLQVTRQIWWAWPFFAVFSLPGFNLLIHAGYRWFARNRYCVSHACRLDTRGDSKK